jgi:transcriptional regulator with XRE-family HTH domain
MNFPEQIKTLRLSRGLSQTEMAQQLFVSQQAISRWENGLSYPDLATLKLIAHTYDIKLDELLGEDYSEAKAEKKVHHSPLFHVLLWASAVLFGLAVTLLILYFAAGYHFFSLLSISLIVEVLLVFACFIPELFASYHRGSRKTILISLIGFTFFAAFSWGSFFTALAGLGAASSTVWLVFLFSFFLSVTAVFFLILFLRAKSEPEPKKDGPAALEKLDKAERIITAVESGLALAFSVLACVYTHAAVWGSDDWIEILLYSLAAAFLLASGLSALCGLIYSFIWGFKKRKSLLLPAGLALVLVISALLPVGFNLGEKKAYQDYYSYTAEKWLAYRGKDRYRMFPSFEANHQLVGVDKTTVYAWLGKEDQIFAGETRADPVSWLYDLGPDGLGIDDYVLEISFSSSDIVTSYSVYDS